MARCVRVQNQTRKMHSLWILVFNFDLISSAPTLASGTSRLAEFYFQNAVSSQTRLIKSIELLWRWGKNKRLLNSIELHMYCTVFKTYLLYCLVQSQEAAITNHSCVGRDFGTHPFFK